MALLFSGAVTSSPIRRRELLSNQSCHSLGLSLLSPDSTYECYSINPLTGSPCSCRRSPRLLSNGYYVLTEDSYVWDDEGNVSLTPSKTNISYKENLVRIFRRRRRARRSLASLFGMSQSWLEGSMFRGAPRSPLAESSWVEESASEPDSGRSFTYDHSAALSNHDKSTHKTWLLEEEQELLAGDSQACLSQEQFGHSLGGFLDVTPTSPYVTTSGFHQKPQPADSAIVKTLFFISLTFCLFSAVFSRWLLGGLTVASITLAMILTSFILTKSTPVSRMKWRGAKTEDIRSRNE